MPLTNNKRRTQLSYIIEDVPRLPNLNNEDEGIHMLTFESVYLSRYQQPKTESCLYSDNIGSCTKQISSSPLQYDIYLQAGREG